MASENTYKDLSPQEKLQAVRCEMAPFFLYAAGPIIFTVIIAFVFGPSLT